MSAVHANEPQSMESAVCTRGVVVISLGVYIRDFFSEEIEYLVNTIGPASGIVFVAQHGDDRSTCSANKDLGVVYTIEYLVFAVVFLFLGDAGPRVFEVVLEHDSCNSSFGYCQRI